MEGQSAAAATSTALLLVAGKPLGLQLLVILRGLAFIVEVLLQFYRGCDLFKQAQDYQSWSFRTDVDAHLGLRMAMDFQQDFRRGFDPEVFRAGFGWISCDEAIFSWPKT